MSNRKGEIVDEVEIALRESEYVTTYTTGFEDYRKAARQVVEVLEKLGVFDIPNPNSEPEPQLLQTHVSGSGSVQKRYRCLLCGRDKFTQKSSHHCIGGYRKRGLKWEEVE